MDFAKGDFDYYERTAQIMYQKYYWKRIAVAAAALVIILGYAVITQDALVINGLLSILLGALVIYLFLQKQKFPELYQKFLQENEPEARIYQVEEDEYSYNLNLSGNKVARVNKKGVRNLPSQNKQYTLMVGFSKNFFAREPLMIAYYDMLELTYEEKFRLTRNGYSNLPRFLRRFTWTNLKASAGNLTSFLLGNIIGLYILFRLLRYLWSMIRMML